MLYLARRIGMYLVAFWAVLTLNFLLPRLIPGDPLSRMFSQAQGQLTPEQIQNLRYLFALDDRSLPEQYVTYIGNVLTGNMGISISRFPTPVFEVIAGQLPWTLLLGGTALVIAVIVGNLLGIAAAWRRGGFLDSVFPPIMIFVGSFPYFWLAMGAVYFFGIVLGWAPLGQATTPGMSPSFTWSFIADVLGHLILPATTIVLVSIGGWMLGMRNTMIATVADDFVLSARARGLRNNTIMLKYAARNAMLPSVTAIGMSLGFVMGGALLTEVVFAYPGVGYQLLTSVQTLDYPLMQGIFLTITAAVLLANFLVDLLYVRLDPRVRTA